MYLEKNLLSVSTKWQIIFLLLLLPIWNEKFPIEHKTREKKGKSFHSRSMLEKEVFYIHSKWVYKYIYINIFLFLARKQSISNIWDYTHTFRWYLLVYLYTCLLTCWNRRISAALEWNDQWELTRKLSLYIVVVLFTVRCAKDVGSWVFRERIGNKNLEKESQINRIYLFNCLVV